MMTPLELQQRGLLDLIKKRGGPPSDAYLSTVAESAGLEMIREIAIWWRELQISAQCYFTSRLLKRLGIFEAMVTDYFNESATSPFVEELSHDFLLFAEEHGDALVRSVAQFESGFLEARAGSTKVYDVLWDRHPDEVFGALESGRPLPDADASCAYRLRIGRELPGMFQCTRESAVRKSQDVSD